MFSYVAEIEASFGALSFQVCFVPFSFCKLRYFYVLKFRSHFLLHVLYFKLNFLFQFANLAKHIPLVPLVENNS